MLTRRTLIKNGGFAALGVVGAPLFVRNAWGQSATVFDYYIGPNGSDSNPGTESQPWAITAINTKQSVYAGKKVGLLDGTYNVYSLWTGQFTSPALRVNGGTANSPTVIAAVNPRQAILTAANPSDGSYPTTQSAIIGQSLAEPNPGNLIIDGLYITRAYQMGMMFYPSNGGAAQGGVTGTVVQNCEVYDIAGWENGNMAGVYAYFQTGWIVRNCRIHHVIPTSGNIADWDCAGIFSQQCSGNLYEYNTVYDCNCGIYDKNAPNGGHTYRYNYVEITGTTYPNYALTDCAGGLPGQTTTVYNNILISPKAAWWAADAISGHFPAVQSLVFYNNTCWYGGGGFETGGAFMPTAGSGAMVTFYNNIVACNGSSAPNGLVCFCPGSVALSNFNCFQTSSSAMLGLSPTSSPYSVTQYSLANWQSTTGLDRNSMAVPLDTLFGAVSSLSPTSYQAVPASIASLGRVGGVSSGAVTAAGAWGNGATQIGCNFDPTPVAPVLTVS